MRSDFSFDQRVAGRYDKQRAHPPVVSEQIGQSIVRAARVGAAVGAPPHILEIGIGTGRIAAPVMQAGAHVTGFDISPNMLAEVGAQAGGLHLLQADMHHLSFSARTFDAVMAIHVLHLARDWQAVLTQAARVLRAGGAFIQGDDWIDPQSVVGRLRDEMRFRVARMAPSFMPPAAGISKLQFLHDLGGVAFEEVIAAEWTLMVSPAERLADIENRIDAESWVLPDELFQPVLAQLRAFSAETWPDQTTPQVVTRRFVLKINRGNW